MALGDPYATVNEFKGYAEHMSDTVDDTQITEVLLQASRTVEKECGRQFNKTTTASARVFHPMNARVALVDDFHTITDLVIATDGGDDGTYETTLTSAEYTLEPLNGVVEGETGWPYSRVLTISTWLPTCNVRPSLQVTAQWGWNAVPTNVKVATIFLALEAMKFKGAQVAGMGDFGPIRLRENMQVMRMLAPYRRYPVQVA